MYTAVVAGVPLETDEISHWSIEVDFCFVLVEAFSE